MAPQFIDASESVLGGVTCLKSHGIKAVGRYYNYGSGHKVLTRQEATALTQQGIGIWTVFQFWNNEPKWFSADHGRKDATRALQCAQELVGQPEGTTIYFSVDYDEVGSNYKSRIAPYFQAVRDVFSKTDGSLLYDVGVYSNGLVCRKLLEDSLVTNTWLSCSTGHAEHDKFYKSKKWSIAQTCGTPIVGSKGRMFLAERQGGKRWHVAVDLFAYENDKVISCEAGRIVSFYAFYPSQSGEMTYALFVQHGDFVINYGEVKGESPKLYGWSIGDTVKGGQEIARVSATGMTHFEAYKSGTTRNERWMIGGPRPPHLLNPTGYLLQIAAL